MPIKVSNDYEFPTEVEDIVKTPKFGDYEVPTDFETPEDKRNKELQAKLKRGVGDPVSNAVGRGLTFGTSDKITAKVRDWMDGPENNYERYVQDQFAQRDAFNEMHGMKAALPEVLGSIGIGGPIASGLKSVGGLLPRAAAYMQQSGVGPTAARVGSVLGGGGAAGAVAGAGQAPIGEEASGAIRGGALGAATAGGVATGGKILQKTMQGARPVTQRIAHGLGIGSPDKWALKELQDNVSMDKDSLGGLASKLRELSGKSIVHDMDSTQLDGDIARDLRLFDVVGPNTKAALSTAARKPNAARVDLDEILSERMRKQGDRLGSIVRKSISKNVSGTFTADDIRGAAKSQVDDLYNQVKAKGAITDPAVTEWFNAHPARIDLLQQYAKNKSGFGKTLKVEVDDQGVLHWKKPPTAEDLINLKNHISDKYSSIYSKIKEGDASSTVNIGRYQGDFADIKELNTSFKEMLYNVTKDNNGVSPLQLADKIHGEAAEVRKAIDAGRHILSAHPDEVMKTFGGLKSEAEKEAFRVGAAESLFKKTRDAGSPVTKAKNMIDSDNLKDKLSVIFPNKDAEAYYKQATQVEKQMAERAAMFPKPKVSMSEIEGSAGMEGLQGIAGLATGNPLQAARGFGRVLDSLQSGMSTPYSEPLLRYGMMDANALEELAAQIAAKQNSLPAKVGGALSAYGRAVKQGAPYASAGLAGSQSQQRPEEELP